MRSGAFAGQVIACRARREWPLRARHHDGRAHRTAASVPSLGW